MARKECRGGHAKFTSKYMTTLGGDDLYRDTKTRPELLSRKRARKETRGREEGNKMLYSQRLLPELKLHSNNNSGSEIAAVTPSAEVKKVCEDCCEPRTVLRRRGQPGQQLTSQGRGSGGVEGWEGAVAKHAVTLTMVSSHSTRIILDLSEIQVHG